MNGCYHIYVFLQNGKGSTKGNYTRTYDPFQVGIILNVDRSKDGSVTLDVRKLYRPENTAMSLLEIGRTNLNLLFW